MTTTTAPMQLQTQLDEQLRSFRTADAAIADLTEQYSDLIISDVNNKGEVKTLIEAHRVVKGYRVKITKRGKELRAPATAFGKSVIAEEKRLLALIEPLESQLDGEREKLRAAERAAAEAEKKAAAEKLQGRVDAMNAVGGPVNLDMLANITDEAFELELRAAREAEAERVAELHRIEKAREAAAAIEQEELRIAEKERVAQNVIALKARMAADAERDRLAEENRLQQAELQRLKQAEAQRVAAERAAEASETFAQVQSLVEQIAESELSREMTEPIIDDNNDHKSHLQAMVDDDRRPQYTSWGLSSVDAAAIQWALDRIAELEAK